MNIKQKIGLGILAGATVVTGLYGVGTIKAADAATTDFPPVIQKLVEKFNLNKDEVSAVLTQDRTERQAEREADFSTKLSEAVTAGKITETQKTAILAKHEEVQAKREALKTGTREDRKTQMQALRTEMQDFLKTQGIDESVMPAPQGPRGGMGEGFGGGMHRGLDQ
jgi:hypothetical protein